MVGGSIAKPARCGTAPRSSTRARPARRTRRVPRTRNAGYGSDVSVRTRAIATWSCSSRPSPIPSALIAWQSRSTGAARSVGSRTCSGAGRGRSSAGTRSPRSASGAGLAPGSLGLATAWSHLCDHGQRAETSSDNVIPSPFGLFARLGISWQSVRHPVRNRPLSSNRCCDRATGMRREERTSHSVIDVGNSSRPASEGDWAPSLSRRTDRTA